MRRSISLRKARAKKLQELKATTTHSLVADSIRHVEEDEEHILTADALRKLGQEKLTREERVKRRRALDTLGVPTFDEFLAQKELALDKGAIEILQLNIGLYCNQACNHCHVESSPKRTEMMTEEVARRCMTTHLRDLYGTGLHLRILKRPAWALAHFPEGEGAEAGSREFRRHFEHIALPG